MGFCLHRNHITCPGWESVSAQVSLTLREVIGNGPADWWVGRLAAAGTLQVRPALGGKRGEINGVAVVFIVDIREKSLEVKKDSIVGELL